MASFSNEAKTEICTGIKTADDRRAFLTGVLLAARRFTADEIAVQTECEAFAVLFPKLLKAAGIRSDALDTEYRQRRGKAPLWCYTLSGKEAVSAVTAALHIDPNRRADALRGCSARAQMLLAAGAFVMCGSVTDPQRSYHLEVALPDAVFGVALQEMLAALEETPIPMKTTVRNNELLLYLKQNEQICDALVYFGAQNAAIELINQQVLRDLRGKTNRRMNCDLANIDKAIAAGASQVAEIEHIAQTVGLDALPESLQQIARLRLEEPEASLRELGAMLEPPISRSGVHHRLQKISEFAAELK